MGAWDELVVGDNLDVMARLAAEGRRYDLAYLDPPYNTGHRFAYDDRLAGGHEAWTAALRPRLEAVRDLLEPTGAVWLSIDDHELAHLRLLCDEVLGEEAFLGQLVVEVNVKGRQLGRWFASTHEYLLVYARDPARCTLDPTSPDGVDPRDFPLATDDGRRYRHLPLRNTNKRFNPATAPSMRFALYGDPDGGRVSPEPFEGAVEVWPTFGDGAPAVWRWSAALVAERPDDLVCRTVRSPLGPRVDVAQRDWLTTGRRKKLRSVWHAEEVGTTDVAVAEIKDLLGAPVFASPKPTALLGRVVGTAGPDARVLDPSAGSGTTAHAVALLNEADGGRRTCTSIETDLAVVDGSGAAAAGYATAADVIRARLDAVAARLGAAPPAPSLRPRRPSPATPARRPGGSGSAAGAAPSGGSR
jgi:adenine-specific DNA-methyltransferase